MLSQTRMRYPIVDSPLYKLRGKGQLQRLLQFDLRDLDKLLRPQSYRVWLNEKNREIQAPVGQLEVIHRRLAKLLARIETPDYLYSRKGRSHITNAIQHTGDVPLIQTDIAGFYPSTTRAMVVRMFVHHFQCAVDIAKILGDICCFRGAHLPTGSALSGYVAFFAAQPLFDAINALATDRSCKMSTFVDDITISGAGADLSLLLKVRRLVKKSGLRTKTAKSRVYGAKRPKPVTGTILKGDRLLLPNRQHKRIRSTRMSMATASSNAREKLKARLKGQLIAAAQVLGADPCRAQD